VNGEVLVRLDRTGGGATLTLPDSVETFTFAEGNLLSRFGSLGLLGGGPERGDEDLYRERFRAELLHAIHRYGLRPALLKTFDITPEDWQ
jgi:hypothetical protein